MGNPLYDTDVIPVTSRPTLTVMDDGDYFLIFDTSTAKISKILRTDAQKALNISYDNVTSGLTATQVQAALDELVVNLGSSDSAISALDGRLDTLEGTGTGSVAKAIDDAVEPIEARVDSTELTLARQGQDLASVKQTLQQGNGATLDFSDIGSVALDARATGRANPTVEGLTATNLAPTTWATSLDGWESAFDSIVANKIRVTATETRDTKRLLPVDITHTYYITAMGTAVSDTTGSSIKLRKNSGSNFLKAGTTLGASETKLLSIYITGAEMAGASDISLQCELVGSGYAEWWEFTLHDLTSIYGAGNEPSEADCAKIFSYFDGTKSIQMPARVRSVGRNLEPISVLQTGGGINSESYGSIIKVIPNSNLLFRCTASNSYRFILRAFTKDMIEITSGLTANINIYYGTSRWATGYNITDSRLFVLNADERIHYVQFGVSTASSTLPVTATNCRVGYGTIDFPYEPYQDSTLYIADSEELRSVPAITDEVKVVNGQLVKVQNVKEVSRVLTDADFEGMSFTGNTNFNALRTNASLFTDIKKTTSVSELVSAMIFSNIGIYMAEVTHSTMQTDAPINTSDVFSYYFGTDKFYFSVPVGTSFEDAKAMYVGTTILMYPLATPITTPLLTSGILKAFQNGSVYFEPYYEGSHQTNASSQIILPYEGTIDKLTGYDENLEPYEVPSTAYTLVGTTLTITGAEENEVYYVELSRSEPLAPEMSVNVLNNEQVTLDTTDGKYYQIGFTTTNGVPTVTATEVV